MMFAHDLDKRLKVLGWGLHAAGLAVAVAIAVVACAAVLGPFERWKEACDARSADLEERLKDADALRNEHDRLKRLTEEVEQRTAALARCIPDEPLEAEFLSAVTSAAGRVGLKIGDYRPGSISVREGHSQLEIQVSCVGPYRSLCAFLDHLAAIERLSRVAHIELNAGGADGCSATMTVVVFFHMTKPMAKKSASGRKGEPAHG
jgi:Tfp pilus assembly protein PilO